jgi:predicted NBD/HSP70 family sugar kinase
MEVKNYPYDSNVKQLFKDAKQGDTLANDILNEWSAYLAEGIAQIQIIYDPDVILIGGAISAQGDNLLNYIVPKLECYLPHNYGHAQIQTALSLNNAALIGAIANLL